MSVPSARRRLTVGWELLSLIAVAGLLRAGALIAWSGHLADDRDDYLTVAGQYVANGFWQPFERMPSSFRPPLYPLILAAILKSGGGTIVLGLLQWALGTATVALVYFAGKKLGLRTGALIAAGLVALDPLLIEYATFPMTETLFTFLVALLIAIAVPAKSMFSNSGGRGSRRAANKSTGLKTGSAGASPSHSPGAPDRCQKAILKTRSMTAAESSAAFTHEGDWQVALRAAAVGVVFGTCVLCRPTIWPTAGLAALWFLWRVRRKKTRAREFAFAGAIAVVSTAIVVLPWGLRNQKILGSPVVTTTHGGYTLLLGNNEDFFHDVAARPLTAEWTDPEPDRFQRRWLQELVIQMDRELGPGAGEITQDRWMYRSAWHSIKAEPRLFFRACVLRFIRFWNVVPLAPARSAIPALIVWGMCIGYVIEMGLFLIGIAGLMCRWDARWGLALIIILNFTLVHLLYWSNMRMRAPLVPLIALVAARALGGWLDRRKVNKCVADPGLDHAT